MCEAVGHGHDALGARGGLLAQGNAEAAADATDSGPHPPVIGREHENGAAMPNRGTMTPPSAGPTARLTLKPTLLAAMAGCGTSLGTS